MKHKLHVKVRNTDGTSSHLLTGGKKRFPRLLARILFGDFSEVLILNPGKTVQGIEIREVPDEK